MNRYGAALIILLTLGLLTLGAVTRPAAQDDVLQRIRTEALERSQVMAIFDSPGDHDQSAAHRQPRVEAAADWSRDRLAARHATPVNPIPALRRG